MTHHEDHSPVHDPTAPEPDTRSGGFYIIVILALTVGLSITWIALAGYYKATFAQPTADIREDIRLRATREEANVLLNTFAAVESDEVATQYRVSADYASTILLANPALLSNMPGAPLQAELPAEAYELPALPSVDDFALPAGDE